MTAPVDLVLELEGDVLEGPAWDDTTNSLVFVDITAGLVHRWEHANGRLTTLDVGQPVGAAIPRSCGGLVVALRDGIGVIDGSASSPLIVAPIEGEVRANLMNDAKCDSRGRLWAGTTHEAERAGAGNLYRIDANHSWRRMVDGVTISNGLGWSIDDKRMYYVDSATRRIDQFDFDVECGEVRNRQTFVSVDAADGVMPDGLTVDADGCVWVALWGGGAVRRYTPDGRLDCEVRLPVAQVTSCAFGGPHLDELFVTTAAIGVGRVSRAAQPGAGGLFRIEPGVSGRAAVPFSG